MKILMTGMTTRTVGSTRLKLDYLNFNPLLKLALEAMGHEVEQRRITVDEDLGRYDLSFLHVTPGDKIVCQNVLEVCSALQRMKGRAIVFLEDWIAVELRNAWEHVLNVRWEKWMAWKNLRWSPAEQHVVRTTITELLNGDAWPVVANFYGWGQPQDFFSKNFRTERTMILDPSPMAVVPQFCEARKERRWVLATLQKHDTWVARQGFTWPVDYYGNERQGHPSIPEKQVTQEYANNWGVLAPRYPVVGWFRPRFLLAAATGSVLYCDSSEGRYLGLPYVVKRSEIEKETDTGLEGLAQEQAECFKAKCWSKDQLFSSLDSLIKALAV